MSEPYDCVGFTETKVVSSLIIPKAHICTLRKTPVFADLHPEPSPTCGNSAVLVKSSDDSPFARNTALNEFDGKTDEATEKKRSQELTEVTEKLQGSHARNLGEVPRPVRLFIGQVPDTMLECHLTELFATKEINLMDVAIIRDKHTGRHRHCAFITVASREVADKAIEIFHNKRYLEAMANPMQIKDANHPKSKAAYAAMKAFSQMFGTPMPMFATPPPKEDLRLQQQNGNRFGTVFSLNPFLSTNYFQQMQMNGFPTYNSIYPQYVYGYFPSISSNTLASVNLGFPVPTSQIQLNSAYISPSQNIAAERTMDAEPIPTNKPRTFNPYSYDHNIYQMSSLPDITSNCSLEYFEGFNYECSPAVYYFNHIERKNDIPYREGPNGANLFVNNLPDTLSDEGLLEIFRGCGEILSCRVFIDKLTQRSKGFGFVSFTKPEDAQRAIETKNGLIIGDDRRIGVELKKPRRIRASDQA